jgi:hypothetical protein
MVDLVNNAHALANPKKCQTLVEYLNTIYMVFIGANG